MRTSNDTASSTNSGTTDGTASSTRNDLVETIVRRNLVTEKYARMMRSTHPEEYAATIEPYIPALSAARETEQETIIATQVAWAREFRERYPKLGASMRVLTTAEDTPDATSFETYLRGELGTYSERTLDLYGDFVARLATEHRNLTEETIGNTVRIAGFAGLDEAERNVLQWQLCEQNREERIRRRNRQQRGARRKE